MGRHLVKWREIPGKNVRNEDCLFAFADVLDSAVQGNLLGRIFEMEPKTPIAFTDAAVMGLAKYMEARRTHGLGTAPGEAHWYTDHFIEWISSLGYHIELTGDEFEPFGVGVPSV